MSGEGAATVTGDPHGSAGGTGDPAAGQGAGTGDPAGDIERLKAALAAERNAHSVTRSQLAQATTNQQGGTAVTQNQNTNQGQGAAAPAEDRLALALQQIAALAEKLEQSEQANIRAAVAKEYGLTDAQASRLVGKTKAELEADAETLTKDFGIKRPGGSGGGTGGSEGGAGGAGGSGNGDGTTTTENENENNGAGSGAGAGTGAARRTTSTLRTGAANEGDAGRVTSRSDADKIAEEVLGSGF